MAGNESRSDLPCEGDTVLVVGHGPGVIVSTTPNDRGGRVSRGRKKYKVRYPDGSMYHVALDQILARETPASPPPAPRSIQCLQNVSPQSSPQLSRPQSLHTGPRMMEYLGRAFDDPSRNVSTRSATFSLIATMVGGGVLSLPYAMSQCGLVLGTLCLLFSAVVSTWTLDMLVDCARCTGRDTFELIGHAALGECGRKVTIALVLAICWLALIAYAVLLADLLVPLVELIPDVHLHFSHSSLRYLTLCGAALLFSPMCFKNGIGALSFMCFASVGSVVTVGAIIVYHASLVVGTSHTVHTLSPSGDALSVLVGAKYDLWPKDWVQALYVFPMFGVSFMCHFNALPTHQEFARPTRPRIRRVLILTMSVTCCLYFIVGVSGYLYAGACTCGNILLNFGQRDPTIAFARAILGLVLMLNMPLICQPCRNALYRLLLGTQCCASPPSPPPSPSPAASSECLNIGDSSSASALVHVYPRESTEGHVGRRSNLEAVDAFRPKDETVQQSAAEPTQLQRYGLTALILTTTLLIACLASSVLVVWSILGSTVCFMVGMILPAVFWRRIMGLSVGSRWYCAAGVLVWATTVVASACTVLTVIKLDAPACPAGTAAISVQTELYS